MVDGGFSLWQNAMAMVSDIGAAAAPPGTALTTWCRDPAWTGGGERQPVSLVFGLTVIAVWAGVSGRIFSNCERLTVVSALAISLCHLFSLAAGRTWYKYTWNGTWGSKSGHLPPRWGTLIRNTETYAGSHGPPLLSFSRRWKDCSNLPFLRFLQYCLLLDMKENFLWL